MERSARSSRPDGTTLPPDQMIPPPAIPRAITIAGSDSGGGAGIQADLKTFAVLGVWGTSAITSITVQNTRGVQAVSDVPPEIVAQQIIAVASDIGVDAAKTGMLSSAPIIEAVALAVTQADISSLVVDPVFVSKHGDPLLRRDAALALRRRIVPLAAIVTPNLPEAAGLAGFDVTTPGDMEKAAREIHALGARSVLVKGGHLADPADRADDVFFDGERMEWVSGERIASPDTHGTGCVLSAAIAAHLARGAELFEAVQSAKRFVTEAIRHPLRLGNGIGPVNPAWRSMEEGEGEREASP